MRLFVVVVRSWWWLCTPDYTRLRDFQVVNPIVWLSIQEYTSRPNSASRWSALKMVYICVELCNFRLTTPSKRRHVHIPTCVGYTYEQRVLGLTILNK